MLQAVGINKKEEVKSKLKTKEDKRNLKLLLEREWIEK